MRATLVAIGVSLVVFKILIHFDFFYTTDVFPISFVAQIKTMYLIIISIILTLPSIIYRLKEYQHNCYVINSHLIQRMMSINRGKQNGHGNAYTKDEEEVLDELIKQRKINERKAKIIDYILLHF